MKSTDDGTIGILFRVNDDSNYYRFSWDNQENFRRLEKRVNGTFTTLAEDSVPHVMGKNYQVSIVAQSDKLQVLVDNQLVFSVTDSSLTSGTLALYARWNSGANFDNVLVEDLKNNDLLLWDDFNDGDFKGWTVMDETTSSQPSVWSVNTGVLTQSTNFGAANGGTVALY
jgi:hypothetical protein